MLIDGLTEHEWKTLKTPLSQAVGMHIDIVRVNDKRITAIRTENKKFIPPKRKAVAIGVISDDLGTKGLRNHADGKMYDSKSEFSKATKRAGCVEIGTEKPKDWKPPIERGVRGDFNVAPALKEALQKHGVK